jgi:hypothetical protein
MPGFSLTATTEKESLAHKDGQLLSAETRALLTGTTNVWGQISPCGGVVLNIIGLLSSVFGLDLLNVPWLLQLKCLQASTDVPQGVKFPPG